MIARRRRVAGGAAAAAALVALLLGAAPAARAQLADTQNSFGWKAITKSGGQLLTDFNLDQQTGTSEGDLVGDANNPLMYALFDRGSLSSLTDGTLYFRVRVGADNSPVGFKSNLLVGLDANADNRIDLFVGVDNSGNPNVLRIWDPGNSANTGPNNSSFSAAPAPGGGDYAYAETNLNYNFSTVTSLDPGSTPDLNADGNTDYFLTFGISFQDITDRLNVAFPSGGRPTALSVNENTGMRFSVVTTQNGSNVNQDAGGLARIGTLPTDVPYDYSDQVFVGAFALPEPGTFALFALGGVPLLGLVARRRRARR